VTSGNSEPALLYMEAPALPQAGSAKTARIAGSVLARVGVGLATVLVLSFITFWLLFSAGDPARVLIGETALPGDLDRVRAEFGFDRPVLVQYWDWLSSFVTGDMGTSFAQRREVSRLLGEHLPGTISIAAVAMVVSTVGAIIATYLATLRPHGLIDRTVRALSALGTATPNFFLAVVFLYYFAIRLRWLPPNGYRPMSAGVWTWFTYLILPALALAANLLSQQIRTLRASVLENLNSDYTRTARSKGLSQSAVLRRHIARNAFLPYLTTVGWQVIRVFSGSIFVETVFAVPGIGLLLVNSVTSQDYPTLQAIVMVIALIVLAANFLVELAYETLNPATRKTS
jgi:peptide/nickel transport system permease protein